MSRVFAAFALILAAFLPLPAGAQSNPQGAGDIFTVSGVRVEARAASAEEARLIAQDQGRSQAFQILLQRLTPSTDWPYLPRPALSDLLDMQVGFEVGNERFSTLAGAQNRYLANITYGFRRDRVRSLLRSEGISFSESQAAPALVLPVFERDGMRQLWEETNQWAVAWYEADFSHELVPMTLPLGDLADMTVVDVDDVVAGNWDALQFLANRYEVSHVFVAHAVLVEDGQGGANLYARLTQLSEDGVGQVVDTRVSGPLSLTNEEPLSGLATRAITLLSGQLQERWKSRTLVSYDSLHRIQATALFSSLAEWTTIRNALEESATVDSYETHAVSPRGAELSVTFAGSPQQLTITLGQRGVALSGTRGYWDLRVRNAQVPELPGRMENGGGFAADGSGYNRPTASSLPPVETIVVQQQRQQNAPVLSEDDLQGIFEDDLTPEEIEARRQRGLGDRPGTMAPVED